MLKVNRAQKKKLFVAMMIIMMIPVLALGQGSFEILPDNVWPKVAEQPPECEHLYGEPILFATERVRLESYFNCRMEIKIYSKDCQKCAKPDYELEYELIPHDVDNTVCKRCGYLMTPPAMMVPLK